MRRVISGEDFCPLPMSPLPMQRVGDECSIDVERNDIVMVRCLPHGRDSHLPLHACTTLRSPPPPHDRPARCHNRLACHHTNVDDIPPAACRAPRSPHAAIRLPLAHTTLGHYHTPPHTLAVIATRRPRRHTLSAIATRSLPSPHALGHRHTLSAIATRSLPSPHARRHRHTLTAIATRSLPLPRAAPRSRPSPHAAIWPPLASRSLPSLHVTTH